MLTNRKQKLPGNSQYEAQIAHINKRRASLDESVPAILVAEQVVRLFDKHDGIAVDYNINYDSIDINVHNAKDPEPVYAICRWLTECGYRLGDRYDDAAGRSFRIKVGPFRIWAFTLASGNYGPRCTSVLVGYDKVARYEFRCDDDGPDEAEIPGSPVDTIEAADALLDELDVALSDDEAELAERAGVNS